MAHRLPTRPEGPAAGQRPRSLASGGDDTRGGDLVRPRDCGQCFNAVPHGGGALAGRHEPAAPRVRCLATPFDPDTLPGRSRAHLVDTVGRRLRVGVDRSGVDGRVLKRCQRGGVTDLHR